MTAKIEIIVGRIETLAVDAVVNAANRRLLPGTGVDGALRAAAGPELTRLTEAMSPIAEGEAVITPGYDAPTKYIIHVAAPVFFAPGDPAEKARALGQCYASAIALAAQKNVRSIAFPCLGTGNYGWPAAMGCSVALAHVDAALVHAPGIERVVFCCFTDADAALYHAEMGSDLR
jgi:O-acetyl-ADP-ribose deacetylase